MEHSDLAYSLMPPYLYSKGECVSVGFVYLSGVVEGARGSVELEEVEDLEEVGILELDEEVVGMGVSEEVGGALVYGGGGGG